MNPLMWLALGIAIYGCALLFILACCKAGAQEDTEREKELRSR